MHRVAPKENQHASEPSLSLSLKPTTKGNKPCVHGLPFHRQCPDSEWHGVAESSGEGGVEATADETVRFVSTRYRFAKQMHLAFTPVQHASSANQGFAQVSLLSEHGTSCQAKPLSSRVSGERRAPYLLTIHAFDQLDEMNGRSSRVNSGKPKQNKTWISLPPPAPEQEGTHSPASYATERVLQATCTYQPPPR